MANVSPTAANATPVPVKNGTVLNKFAPCASIPTPAQPNPTPRTVGQHGDWPNGSWPS